MATRSERAARAGPARAAAVSPDERVRSEPPWHARSPDEVVNALASSPDGLTAFEAALRLAQYGPNVLVAARPERAWRILVRQLRSVVVVLLVVATVFAAVSGHAVDAASIAAVLVLNVAIGFITELRARRAMDALLRLAVPAAVVRRAGTTHGIEARDLVPGDVIELEAGQAVPADARLLTATSLESIEAALTGESTAVAKSADAVVAANVALPDRTTMVYRGTTITSGVARAMVVATGMRTEVGRIGALVRSIRDEPTLLERRLDAMGRRLAGAAIGVGVLVAAVQLFHGATIASVIQLSIAVAIAAVPEGLPAVVTTTMAVATRRMAKRHALVRRLPAVETLGAITVVCTDKTGTLTAGRQTATILWIPDTVVALDGADEAHADGGGPRGGPLAAGGEQRIGAALAIGALATRAEISRVDEHWEGVGDPTEIALLLGARHAGLVRSALLRDWPEVASLPFSSERMLMATFHAGRSGSAVFAKGAPGRILERCARIAGSAGDVALDDRWRAVVAERAQSMAAKGLRVLALADGRDARVGDQALAGLRFVGLIGIVDPPADGVVETIAVLRGAGIRAIMLTGDLRATAVRIARDIGLVADATEALDGAEVDRLTDAELAGAVGRTGVVSRASPEAKLRIVAALQRAGEVVAMLGDGINDAAALRKADIGVAMGGRGTDAAKEVAGIVLADDRFPTIAAAVEEGRVVFENIRKFAFYLLGCNLAEIFVLLGAQLAGLPLPMTPIQILWLNLVTDSFPALALAIEPAEADLLRRPPRAPSAALLSRTTLARAVLVAIVIGATAIAALVWDLVGRSGVAAHAVTLSFTTLALAQVFHLGNARSERHVLSRRRIAANRYALAAVAVCLVLQALAVLAPPLRTVLGTVPLSASDWLLALGLALIPAVLGQTWKLVRYADR